MKTLTAVAIAWPLLLAAVVLARVDGSAPLWTSAVYAIGSRICHQIPARSFHTAGVQWPVCARCAGLYIAAPIGAVMALGAARVRRAGRSRLSQLSSWAVLIPAAIPTALTLAIEWPGLGAPSNVIRAVCALPLGAALAFLVVRAAGSRPQAIG
jgi:uncharacterized membrane protein